MGRRSRARRGQGEGSVMSAALPSYYRACNFIDLGQQKPARRTKADIAEIRRTIFDVVAANHPMTVRQIFYALTVAGAIEKTEQEYKGTVIRLLTAMRRAGELPYRWISD